jgi:hypothetical protein
MLEDGLDPAPQRRKGMSWAEFLAVHWEQIAAADFFTVEVMTLRGLVRYSVLLWSRSSCSAILWVWVSRGYEMPQDRLTEERRPLPCSRSAGPFSTQVWDAAAR